MPSLTEPIWALHGLLEWVLTWSVIHSNPTCRVIIHINLVFCAETSHWSALQHCLNDLFPSLYLTVCNPLIQSLFSPTMNGTVGKFPAMSFCVFSVLVHGSQFALSVGVPSNWEWVSSLLGVISHLPESFWASSRWVSTARVYI